MKEKIKNSFLIGLLFGLVYFIYSLIIQKNNFSISIIFLIVPIVISYIILILIIKKIKNVVKVVFFFDLITTGSEDVCQSTS